MFGTWSCAGDILNNLGFYHKGKRTAQYLKQWSLALERQYRRRDSSLKQNTSKRGVSWVLTAKDNTSHLSSEPKERTLLRRKKLAYSEQKRLLFTMKIAIIGAGVSGLVSIKSCLDEGLEPVCFEKSEEIGGLWKFSDDPTSAAKHGSVYESTVINTSKEMTCFSDLPAPKHFPPFMPRGHVEEYLRIYAEHFDLVKFIRFQSIVLEISRTPDHRRTRWTWIKNSEVKLKGLPRKWEVLREEKDNTQERKETGRDESSNVYTQEV